MSALFSYPKRKLKKLVKEGDYKEAVEFAQSLIEKNPKDPDLYFMLGSIFYILKDAKASLKNFDKVLEIKKYDAETLILKANVHVFLKEFDTAKECCEIILDKDPENNEARNLLDQLDTV